MLSRIDYRLVSGFTFGLLLSSSLFMSVPAHAATVEFEGERATAIRDLVVDGVTYDVVFTDLTTPANVYGAPPGVFDFSTSSSAAAAVDAVNAALTAENALGVGASGEPRSSYAVGYNVREEGVATLLDVWTGTNVDINDPWVRLDPSFLAYNTDRFVFAEFTEVDDAPSFSITAGITGSWFDPERDGEGYNLEVIEVQGGLQMVAYYYTYDGAGNQMWLSGVGPIVGNTATVPVQVTSGPVFGAGYDPNDVAREDWGTLTFTFSSCNAGTAMYDSTLGFGAGTFGIVRLTSVASLACP